MLLGASRLEVWTQHCSGARLHSLYHTRHGNIVSIFFSLQHQSLLKPFKQRWNNSLFVLCGLSAARRDRSWVLRTCRIHSLKVETIFPLSVNSISGESVNHYKISFCFPTLIILKTGFYLAHICADLTSALRFNLIMSVIVLREESKRVWHSNTVKWTKQNSPLFSNILFKFSLVDFWVVTTMYELKRSWQTQLRLVLCRNGSL